MSSTAPAGTAPQGTEATPQELVPQIRKYFDWEHRKHPSCLLYDTSPNNFLVPSETFARDLLGNFDRNLRILEIGSGDSIDSCTLAGKTNRVWGIDVSHRRLKLAREVVTEAGKADRILPIHMDANRLAFPDASFDLILGNSVLLFLDKERIAAECARVLKPGGRAVFTHESMGRHPMLFLWRFNPRVRERESVSQRITLKDIEGMARHFSSVRHEEFYLGSVFLAPFVRRWGQAFPVRAAVRTAYAVDRALVRLVPPLRHLSWIAVIEFRKAPAGAAAR